MTVLREAVSPDEARRRSMARLLWGILDAIVVTLMLTIFAVLSTLVEPHDTLFRCDDISIAYPRLRNIVTPQSLAGLIFLLPFMVIAVVEQVLHERGGEVPKRRCFPCPCNVSSRLSRPARLFALYLFGLLACAIFTQALKVLVGRPRPNFLAACNSMYLVNHCVPGRLYNSSVCSTVLAPKQIWWDARESFPSGHSSATAYASIWLSYYLERRFAPRQHSYRMSFMRPLSHGILITVALVTASTRVVDYHHHPSDVIAGFILGGCVAWGAFTLLVPKLRKRKRTATNDFKSDSGGYRSNSVLMMEDVEVEVDLESDYGLNIDLFTAP